MQSEGVRLGGVDVEFWLVAFQSADLDTEHCTWENLRVKGLDMDMDMDMRKARGDEDAEIWTLLHAPSRMTNHRKRPHVQPFA